MASSQALRRRAVGPVAAAIGATAAIFYRPRTVLAEAPPEEESFLRKPIYDSTVLDSTTNPPPSSEPDRPYKPTPTDRLATQVGRTRVALHSYAVAAEDAVNRGLTRALHLEHSFTETVASLAPPRASGERLVPGLLYVLVGTMAGSMVSRNRNFVLRAAVPAAFGLGVAYTVLPRTMRNVGDLVWSYERRWPVLAENHMRVRDRVERFVETGKAHTSTTLQMLEDKVGGAREGVEDWVRKGK